VIVNKEKTMYKICVPLMFVIFAFMSCGDEPVLFLTIDEYLDVENISTQVTPTGLHYIIRKEGEEPNPFLPAKVNINYDGFFLQEGNVTQRFDMQENVDFNLHQLILGWQEGLQLIGTGGQITLLVPSNLAYGVRGAGSIPSNTDIGFDIDLLGFQYATIEEYLTQVEFAGLEESQSGLRYAIADMGVEPNPMINSNIVVSYEMSFFGEEGFKAEQGFKNESNVQLNVEDLIPGFQEGIQLIGTGGRMVLLVPSELAYGAMGTNTIPPNTDIQIDVHLLEIE